MSQLESVHDTTIVPGNPNVSDDFQSKLGQGSAVSCPPQFRCYIPWHSSLVAWTSQSVRRWR